MLYILATVKQVKREKGEYKGLEMMTEVLINQDCLKVVSKSLVTKTTNLSNK